MVIKLSALPHEAKLTIVQYLTVRDYLNLAATSQYWSDYIMRNARYLPKWRVDEFSVRCLDEEEENVKLACEAVIRGKPTKIKKFIREPGNDFRTAFQRINVTHSLYLELNSHLSVSDIFTENAKRVQQLALQITNFSKFPSDYFHDLISALPRCEVVSLEMDGSDERHDGTILLQAIPILRHIEIRSLNSPFSFDDSSLEVLTQKSDADNAIDCLVLSTGATEFSVESVRRFLENTVFLNYAFIQFSKINGSYEEFLEMLMQVGVFDSEPTRGIFSSFVVIINATLICINIQKFSIITDFYGA